MGRGDNGDDNETKKERVVLIQSSTNEREPGLTVAPWPLQTLMPIHRGGSSPQPSRGNRQPVRK
jgi:hypothetical protein